MKLDLCIALGKTQGELLSQMSTEDFIEWAAYKRVKPFGYDVDNIRFGEICAAIINAAGKTFDKNVKWTDFFTPSYGMPETKKVDPVNSLLKVFTAMAAQQEKQDKQAADKKKSEDEESIKKAVKLTRRRKRK